MSSVSDVPHKTRKKQTWQKSIQTQKKYEKLTQI